jgi:hypothetical protein
MGSLLSLRRESKTYHRPEVPRLGLDANVTMQSREHHVVAEIVCSERRVACAWVGSFTK